MAAALTSVRHNYPVGTMVEWQCPLTEKWWVGTITVNMSIQYLILRQDGLEAYAFKYDRMKEYVPTNE